MSAKKKSLHFQFDARKSESNKHKHGIDFDYAQKIWDGLIFEFPIHGYSEMRYLVLGKIDGVHYTEIICYRGGSIRIISARRSNEKEVRQYAISYQKIEYALH